MMIRRLFPALLSMALVACQTPYVEQSHQHLSQSNYNNSPDIPALVLQKPQLPPPVPQARRENKPRHFTVVVTQAPVRELLTSIAQDARLNADVHPAIDGVVTLNAIRQTLPQILDRIADQTRVRWSIKNDTIVIEPDTPFLKTYNIDYVNIVRQMKSSIGASSSVSNSSDSGGSNSGGSEGGSNSQSNISNESKHDFWKNLIQSLENMLAQEDRVSVHTQIQNQGSLADAQSAAQGAAALGQKVSGGGLAADGSPAQNNQNSSSGGQNSVRIVAHPETGTLSIRANAQQHQHIASFLRQIMQSAHRQVLIEATIAEVELSRNFDAGIDWTRILSGGRLTYSQSFSSLLAPNRIASSFALPVMSYTNAAGTVASTVKMLEQFGKTKVLSSPKMMALNNQAAMLKATRDIPYFTLEVERTEATANSPAVVTYSSELKTVSEGIVMNIQPQIAANGEITLNVRPTISKIIGSVRDPAVDLALGRAGVPNAVPVVQVRELESTLRLSSGQIAILGGLIQDEVEDHQVGIPGFSRLPLLGNFFKYRSDSSKKTELVVFLKPTLVNDPNIQTDLNPVREMLPAQDFFDRTDYDQLAKGYPAFSKGKVKSK